MTVIPIIVMVLTIVNIVVKITMFCTAVVILLAVIIMTWRRSFDACRIFLMTIHHWSGDVIYSYHHQNLWLIQWFWQRGDAAPYDDHHMKIWWSSYGKSIVHASSNGFDDGETPLQLKAIEDAGANLQIGDDVNEQNTMRNVGMVKMSGYVSFREYYRGDNTMTIWY